MKRESSLYYGVVILVAVVYSVLFELPPISFWLVVIFYVLCVPKILYNKEKFAYEIQRFNDINAYMSQMAQSFIYTKDVIKSLEETYTCFPKGRMNETLREALRLIEDGKYNIKQAELEALEYIESCYDCEKARSLHAYFLHAETLGGDCKREFMILERMRIAWQGVVESIYIKKFWDRNIGAIIYAFFLMVCIIMLHIMRGSNLDIMGLLPTQIIDTIMLLGFALFFMLMDNRLNKSLLMNPSYMSETSANVYYDYLENYNPKKEQNKYAFFSVLSLIISILFLYIKPTWITLAMCLCIIFVSFHIHTIIHVNAIRTIKYEIKRAFPKWLFDLMLLLQRESVEGAIEQSVETAPPVLKRELACMVERFSVKAHNPDAYMSFLREYNIQSITEIMHKLYSLAVGANRDSEVLDVVMEKNIKNLEKAERDSMMLKDNMKSFTWIPFLCVGFGCIGYLVVAITTSINGIIDLIG